MTGGLRFSALAVGLALALGSAPAAAQKALLTPGGFTLAGGVQKLGPEPSTALLASFAPDRRVCVTLRNLGSIPIRILVDIEVTVGAKETQVTCSTSDSVIAICQAGALGSKRPCSFEYRVDRVP